MPTINYGMRRSKTIMKLSSSSHAWRGCMCSLPRTVLETVLSVARYGMSENKPLSPVSWYTYSASWALHLMGLITHYSKSVHALTHSSCFIQNYWHYIGLSIVQLSFSVGRLLLFLLVNIICCLTSYPDRHSEVHCVRKCVPRPPSKSSSFDRSSICRRRFMKNKRIQWRGS